LGSYSKLGSDAHILQQVGEAKSVTIIGCPYCANQSLAYDKEISVIGESSLGGLRGKTYVIAQEADRIKALLESKGISATVKIFGLPHWGLCWQNGKDRKAVAKACERSEAAIALSCFAGCEGIKSALPESFKVIPAMFNAGTISAYLSVEKGKVVMDKDKTKVHLFKDLKQPV
jgi:hypothetical protein